MGLRTRFCLRGLVIGLLVLAVQITTTDATVLKNKETGETISGTLSDQQINGKNVFTLYVGGTIFINLAEWEEVGAATEETEVPPAAPTSASLPPTDLVGGKAYVFPLTGVLQDHATVEALEQGLEEANRQKVAVIILHIDSPGGRLDLADKIVRIIEQVDWAPVVTWVEGNSNRALSAAAFISLATSKIYMSPGATLGAATPFRQNIQTGAVEVDIKLTSAFRARFRSLAEMHGYPTALVDAMVDSNVSVVEVFLNDKPMLVTADVARQLETAHRSDGQFKMGRVVSKRGELLTLTSQEAVAFGICAGVVNDCQDVLTRLRLGGCTVLQATWVPALVERLTKQRKAKVEAMIRSFEVSMTQAEAHAQAVQSALEAGAVATAKRNLSQYVRQVESARDILASLEKLASDEQYDMAIPPEAIAEAKNALNTHLETIKALQKKL